MKDPTFNHNRPGSISPRPVDRRISDPMHDSPSFDVGQAVEAYPERANLYRLQMSPHVARLYVGRDTTAGTQREVVCFQPFPGGIEIRPSVKSLKRALYASIIGQLRRSELSSRGFRLSNRNPRFPRIVDATANYAPQANPGSAQVASGLGIYPAYTFQVMYFGGAFFLCLDHRLLVRSVLSLAKIEQHDPEFGLALSQRVFVRDREQWQAGKFVGSGDDGCHIALASGEEAAVTKLDVIPDLTRLQVARLAPMFGLTADLLERRIKQLSFLTAANAPLARLDTCSDFVRRVGQVAFPICEGPVTIALDTAPAALRPPCFTVGKDLTEPEVALDHVDRSKRARDILTGLTRFGAFEKPSAPLRLALISTTDRLMLMEQLVERLNAGSVRYPGAQRVFGSVISIRERVVCPRVEDYEEAIRRYVRGHACAETDVALVYLPKGGGEARDPNHPYYRVKRLLVREGLVSQMVDEATVCNPTWRDLNLALNIYAKAGYAPWVLDAAIPEVDLFIGLSSSSLEHNGTVIRMMGYVNVFDAYGRWQFYQGDASAFAFDERLTHYGELVRNSIAAYQAKNGGALRTVHIHLTKPFSTEERRVLAAAVRNVAPGCAIVFVWVDVHHPLRLYDLSAGRDGSIARATYLPNGGDLYVATTGSNSFNQKGMGTPVVLRLVVWSDPPDAPPATGLVAQQVVSLTRLNWASSRNFCQEPITTKFAGDIAKFMAAFIQDDTFSVNPRLRDTPWFL